MKKQISDRTDITLLVESFYTKVREDDLLGPIFQNAENFSWDTHIPIMIDFWETILLDAGSYRGNTISKHIELNKRTPLNSEHFDRWKELFYGTLDTHFEGEKVAEAKKRAELMAGLMIFKIGESQKKGFIQ